MDSNETTNTTIGPPEPLLSDYVEMTYLLFVISVGIPSNVIILRKLFMELKRTPRDSIKSGFILLKINLNISDIFLLLVAFIKLMWMYTYEWRFGDFTCRAYQFLSAFSLYVSSNVVVCIAIDRLKNVINAYKMQRGHKHINPVKLIVTISWVIGFLCSLPQLYVFRNFNIFPEHPQGWYQCTDIWQYYRNMEDTPYPKSIMTTTASNTYAISHLLIVFWIPVVFMLISYIIIACKLMEYSLQGVQTQTDSTRKTNEEDSCLVAASVQEALLSAKENDATERFWTRIKSAPLVDTIRRPSRFMITVPPSSRRPSAAPTPQVKVPAWRRQLRSKVFRTTLLVVVTHVVCWFPYNTLSLMKYIDSETFEMMQANMNVFKDLQFLITLINPFLYGFSK